MREQLFAVLAGDLSRVEAPEMDRLYALLDTGGDVLSRYHYDPGHVTGSAFVVHPSRQAVALVHHDKLDLWVQPGGHLEPSDVTVEAGALREVAEEIGMTGLEPLGPVDMDIHTFPARADQPTHLHFDVRYGFRAASERLLAGEGVRAASWVATVDALSMDESVARPVRRIADLLGW